MADRLKGKVAIVTGAGSSGPGWGNGKATAALFAREGAKVFGIDLNPAAVKETADAIAVEKGAFTAHVADVTDDGAVQALVKACLDAYGRVDVLVNNVGVYETGSIESRDVAYWDRVNRINMTSMFLMFKYVVPQMVKQGQGGSCVSLSSISGIRAAGSDYSIYCATKAAILGLSRQLTIEYAKHKIRFNCVLPGITNTPLALEPIRKRVSPEEFQKILGERDARVPIGRAGTGWDVAKAVLFLASDDAEYVTGAELIVDGGLTCTF